MIGGGGTGGHIFPALAIAGEVKHRYPNAEILFLGAEGRMEMTRVPEAGFQIVGLPIAGLQRRLALSNLALPFKVFVSLQKAIALVRSFRPDVVVGVGGYASAPLLLAARILGIPYLIQEQNSFAGLTNKLLGRKAKAICVAFPSMNLYFPEKKIHFTGNPIRKDLLDIHLSPYESLAHFGLQPGVQTILAMGGSLGAKTINEAISKSLADWSAKGYQLIWQTGKSYAESAQTQLAAIGNPRFISMPFIKDMNHAYSASDVVISRAGALSIAEICITGKASILIPSPNVAEDHQTKNAMTLVNQNAAVLVSDMEARATLTEVTNRLLNHPQEIEQIGMAAYALARPDATKSIVNHLIEIARK